jgi:hypothetical protein
LDCDFLKASEFFANLLADERVYLLVRHGERGHITPGDPDYGAHVGLTERGREQALALGRAIPAEGDICFYSSPVGRCVQTAECIGRGCGVETPEVQKLDCLAEFFVQDYTAYEQVLRAGFYEGICAWLENETLKGVADGSHAAAAIKAFFPLVSRSEEMLSMMLEKGNARFNIFATHDAWVVPCLTHFCGMRFTPQRWMNFLTGMAVVTGADGKRVRRIVPVTGLETGWLEF